MNRTLYLALFLILLSWSSFPARAWYIGEEEFAGATFRNDELSHYNYAAESNDVNLIVTSIEPNSHQRPLIDVEITNRNCRERKSYPTYYYTPSGEKMSHSVDHPVWGILWGYRDTENYHALLLRTGESDPQGYNPPTLQYCIFTVAEGDTLLHSAWLNTPDSYLNPEADYNHLLIQPVDGGFEIFIGERNQHRLGFCNDDRLFGNQAGIFVGSGANVAVRNWSITAQPYTERAPYWSETEIWNHLIASNNPYEGVYDIITSSSSSSNIRLGGSYRMALICDNNKYKLLYLDGAQRAADLWKPGMVKADLHPISGGEIFQVTWYDVNHSPLSEDITATISPKSLKILFLSTGTQLLLIQVSPE